MERFKNTYRIESARLKGWDYSKPGEYFITICTKNHENIFGEIINSKMILNEYGEIVNNCWNDLPSHYQNLILDEFIIMPNHLHGIMIINYANVETGDIVETGDTVETGLRPVSTCTTRTTSTKFTITGKGTRMKIPKKNHGISEFIRALKSFSSRRINKLRDSKLPEIWQPRFYDHIIRNDIELYNIRRYIINNPLNWKNDKRNNDK